MEKPRTAVGLLVLALVAVGLTLALWLSEPELRSDSRSGPMDPTDIDLAKQPDADPRRPTKPAGNSPAVPGLKPRPLSGTMAAAADSTPPPAAVWPDSQYTDDEYQLSKIQIYRQFQQVSTSWTIETYQQIAARADELSGREIYELYTYLRACHQQPRSVEQLDQRVSRIRNNRRMQRRMAPEDIERIVENYQQRLVRCEALPDDEVLIPLMLDWLTMAARRGFPQAQIAYHRSARWLLTQDRWGVYRYPDRVREYQQLAPQFLELALESGHHDALYEYSLALRENIIFDEDPVASYAYAVAANLATPAGNEEAREIMALLETVLDAGDLRTARAHGRELCQTYCRPDQGPA